ncbi:MAG: helix-turn-helix domain-containing protein [Oscillospiraceae bacterium]|nr:helix-turn-helix domain-containing protein [Oscillospiraceae bacterium]
MAKKVGTLIKEARTNAGLTQDQLAKKVRGLTASDVSKAERGEKELTQEQLKSIAKATGVTQKSLLDAAKGGSSSKPASSRPASTGVKLSAEEKKLVSLWRKADDNAKQAALKALEKSAGGAGDLISELLGNALGALTGKK